MLHRPLSEVILSRRLELDIPQGQLAECAQISKPRWSQVEHGAIEIDGEGHGQANDASRDLALRMPVRRLTMGRLLDQGMGGL
jgi:hypothetical protein